MSAELAATLRDVANYVDTLPDNIGISTVTIKLTAREPHVGLDFNDLDEAGFRRIATEVLPDVEWKDMGDWAYACGLGLPEPIRFVSVRARKPEVVQVSPFADVLREVSA